ncbi:hypothetical protein QR510_30135, partial [Escherichia coli]|uniref:hypothetical protein n=1 Tax=Escherichia coli TaxID=562 RepID=UPI0027395355
RIIGSSIGILTIDGIKANINDRILLINQIDKKQNGVYKVINNDSNSVFIIERENFADESIEIPGSTYYVLEGNTLARTTWI